MNDSTIKSFSDLVVYKNLYISMIRVHKEILPKLPLEEKYGLVDQMRRASKAGPALLAEGFAKRYQRLYWRKYLTDTIGECNEMIHHLSVCIDLYGEKIDNNLCNDIKKVYEVSCKQLTRLGQVWTDYHNTHS